METRVVGTWTSRPGLGGRPGGTLAIGEVGSFTGVPDPADELRTYLRDASRRLYGQRAGMVDALILGTRGGIDPELQDRFAWSGLVHLLSISGFHVGSSRPGCSSWDAWRGCVAPRARARGGGERGVRHSSWDGPRRPGARPRWRCSRRSAGSGNVTCWPTPCSPPPASASCWSTPGRRWISADGSRPPPCGARRRSAGGPTGSSESMPSGGRSAPPSVPRSPPRPSPPSPWARWHRWVSCSISPPFPWRRVAVPGVLASLVVYPLSTAGRRRTRGRRGTRPSSARAHRDSRSGGSIGHVLLEPGDTKAGLLWAAALAAGLWAIGSGNTVGETGRRLAWLGGRPAVGGLGGAGPRRSG